MIFLADSCLGQGTSEGTARGQMQHLRPEVSCPGGPSTPRPSRLSFADIQDPDQTSSLSLTPNLSPSVCAPCCTPTLCPPDRPLPPRAALNWPRSESHLGPHRGSTAGPRVALSRPVVSPGDGHAGQHRPGVTGCGHPWDPPGRAGTAPHLAFVGTPSTCCSGPLPGGAAPPPPLPFKGLHCAPGVASQSLHVLEIPHPPQVPRCGELAAGPGSLRDISTSMSTPGLSHTWIRGGQDAPGSGAGPGRLFKRAGPCAARRADSEEPRCPAPRGADDDRLHPSGGVGGRCADVRHRVRSVANAQPTRALR